MLVIGDIARLGAKRYPDKKAVVMDEAYFTYKQLNEQANQLAHGLLSQGLNPGDKIALMANNCLEYPIVCFAAAKCGCIFVPVNFRFKKNELVHVINNSEAKVLFFGREFLSLVEEAKAEFNEDPLLVPISGEMDQSGVSLEELMSGGSTLEPPVLVEPASPAAIMYTSGTTGFPKGALFSHSSSLAVHTGLIVEGDLGHNDITLIPLPLFHNAGLNMLLMPSLTMGATSIILTGSFDPDRFLDSITRYNITLTECVPTQLIMLINHPGATQFNVSSLKKMWYGSSAISPEILKASMDFFSAGFYQWYGQTEVGVISVLRPGDHIDRSQFTGREMFNADMRIVNQEGMDTQIGEVGEIISVQKQLGMIGYHKIEEANMKTIKDGWIHTEDLARVEGGGYFTVVDRLRDMIISGAENIYSKEIEDIIIEHPEVKEVTVIGIPDEKWGEAVCAVVVKKEGCQVTEDEIIGFCASELSSYKKPKRVDFRDDLPKNASGKITKNVLRDFYWAGKEKRV